MLATGAGLLATGAGFLATGAGLSTTKNEKTLQQKKLSKINPNIRVMFVRNLRVLLRIVRIEHWDGRANLT